MPKKLVQYGAGNIGRGFIGDLFSRAGYEVVFVDVMKPVVARFNADHAYPIRYVSDDGASEYIVTGVRAVDGADIRAVADEIADADIMATAVGVPILPRIVKPIVYGLRARWARGNDAPLNIIICENKLDADKYLKELFLQELMPEEREHFKRTVGLVEASIGRMVPVMTPGMQGDNPLLVCVERYAELPVDRDGFKGAPPAVPGMLPASPFGYYIRRKLFIHNMGHAITAYLGCLSGARFIADAVRDAHIRLLTTAAMRQSARALSMEYDVPLGDIFGHIDDLIWRFHNRMLGDTTERVCRDPVRKLAQDDRLAGAALLCDRLRLPNAYICAGVAAGLLYVNEDDAASVKIQSLIAGKGVAAAMREFCGISPDSGTGALVLRFYDILRSGAPLCDVLYEADKIVNA